MNRNLIEKYISVRPEVQGGRPCIRNTRTPVHVILEALATGLSFEEVKKEFAPLTDEEIQACILYASLLTDEQELIPQTK